MSLSFGLGKSVFIALFKKTVGMESVVLCIRGFLGADGCMGALGFWHCYGALGIGAFSSFFLLFFFGSGSGYVRWFTLLLLLIPLVIPPFSGGFQSS